MVPPSRSSASLRRREETGKLFISTLIFLGLVASIFLIFSDSVQFIRIGLVVALWAAVIGALTATKYRKEAAIDKAKVGDLQTVYRLQLDREISARREYELGVEERVRREVGADAAEMAALRAELAVLRQNLQRLFDGELPIDRPVLRAESTRVQQLPSGQPSPATVGSPDAGGAIANATGWNAAVDAWADSAARLSRAADGWAGPPQPNAVTPVYDTDHPDRPQFAGPDDDPVTAETAIITDEELELEATRASSSSKQQKQTRAVADESEADATPAATDSAASDPASAAPTPLPAPESASVQQTPQPASAAQADSPTQPTGRRAETTASAVGSATSRRRRRAAADPGTKRLSVAEIMANLQSEQQQHTR